MSRITNIICVRRDFWGPSSPIPCSKLISSQLLLQNWSIPTSCRSFLAKIFCFLEVILTSKISVTHSFGASQNLCWYQLWYHFLVIAVLAILETAYMEILHHQHLLNNLLQYVTTLIITKTVHLPFLLNFSLLDPVIHSLLDPVIHYGHKQQITSFFSFLF